MTDAIRPILPPIPIGLAVLLAISALAPRVASAQGDEPATGGGTLSGFVEDAETGERLVGATVTDRPRAVGAVTNAFGYFALPLPSLGRVGTRDSVAVEVRYLGYATFLGSLALAEPATVRLVPVTVESDGVTVEADAIATVGGDVRLSARDVERVPALLGEADPLKALQLSPAVRAGAEGSSGLHVRGGSPDQTLLLLDGAPVYNAAHLAGAVSVFNSDALQSALLVPGAAPARYGGRLSAVVDVTQREGNRERRTGTATVGLLASRALVEGPLADGRGSYVVSGRRTYADLLARPLLFQEGTAAGYYFQDATAKVNLDLDPRTRVYASAYYGRDRFYRRSGETFTQDDPLDTRTDASSTGIEWGNVTATARATRVVSPRVFASGLVYYSQYDFAADRAASQLYPQGSTRETSSTTFSQGSGLRDVSAQADVEVAVGPAHTVEAGVSVQARRFRPTQTLRNTGDGSTGSSSGDPSDTTFDDPTATWGGGAYVSDAVRLGRSASAEVGLRADWLATGGRLFTGLQPRLRATATLGDWTAHASAGRSWQPLHLLTNAGVGLPTDLWVPATERAPPASAWQASLGAERPLGRGWTGSASAFAKTMSGLVEYRDGTGFFSSGASWEDAVTTGAGRAYGVELALGRAGGRVDVQLAYALSRSTRTFAEIDGGDPFPYRYDRTHDLSAVVTRHLSPRRRLTALASFSTGAAVTAPVARFGQSPVYGDRNSSRFPLYHRIDLSYEVDYGRGRLALGVYNAYNRLNPYYQEFTSRYDQETRSRRVVVRRVSLFPILPSVSYRFSF